MRRTLIALGLVASSLVQPVAAADLKTYSPIIEKGELSFEARGNVAVDGDPAKGGAQDQRYSVEFAPTRFWQTALYGNLARNPGSNLKFEATAWENNFQLFPKGSHWLDAGLYLEYERAHDRSAPDAVEAKLLLEKNIGRMTLTVNPIFEKEIGPHAGKALEFKYAARAKWRLMPEFEPAIEVYGDIGELKNLDDPPDQRHQIGPVILGKFRLTESTALKYETGYLFGLTSVGSPGGAFKWLLELEFRL